MSATFTIDKSNIAVSANTTRFLTLRNHTSFTSAMSIEFRQQARYVAGTISRLVVRISSNTVSATSTLRSRINGSYGNLSISITASTTGTYQDITNSDTTADGDLVCLELAAGATGTSLSAVSYSTKFQASTNSVYMLRTNKDVVSYSSGPPRRYNMAAGGGDASYVGSEPTEIKLTSLIAGTLKNFGVLINSNSDNGTVTGILKVNSTIVNGAFSISSGATGVFTDTTHTDSVSTGNTIHYRFESTGTTGNIVADGIGCDFETTDGSAMLILCMNDQSMAGITQ